MGCVIGDEVAEINRIVLKNFRSFALQEFSFKSGVNSFFGENGIGKTNLLEAIYLISTGRSFRTTNLSEMVRHGEREFFIKTDFTTNGIAQTLQIAYDGKTKRIKHNETSYTGFSSLIGLLPSVLYSPSDIHLITGSPGQRRRFLNLQIAQKRQSYLQHLAHYHRALKQRNALLKQKKVQTIELWEEEMIKHATPVLKQRRESITRLSHYLSDELQGFFKSPKQGSLSYHPSIEELSQEHFNKMRPREIQFGYSLYGPHRDDFQINLDNMPARLYASEGEKRLLITALKLGAYRDLNFPIFAIDDFGIHLDPKHSQLLEDRLLSLPQVFTTSTSPLRKVPFPTSLEPVS